MRVREVIEFLKLCDPDVAFCYPYGKDEELRVVQ
jgi:hypothetical protein